MTIFKRREPQVTPEHLGQMIAVVHADAPCDLVDGQVGLGQKTAGERQASVQEIFRWRHTGLLPEVAQQAAPAHGREVGDVLD